MDEWTWTTSRWCLLSLYLDRKKQRHLQRFLYVNHPSYIIPNIKHLYLLVAESLSWVGRFYCASYQFLKGGTRLINWREPLDADIYSACIWSVNNKGAPQRFLYVNRVHGRSATVHEIKVIQTWAVYLESNHHHLWQYELPN